MKNANAWKVFNTLANTFTAYSSSGATPQDFHNFLTTVRNGMPEGKSTVLEVLTLDSVADHEDFLREHAREEICRILQ